MRLARATTKVPPFRGLGGVDINSREYPRIARVRVSFSAHEKRITELVILFLCICDNGIRTSDPTVPPPRGLGGVNKSSRNPREAWVRVSFSAHGVRGLVLPILFFVWHETRTSDHKGSPSRGLGGVDINSREYPRVARVRVSFSAHGLEDW